MIEKNREGVNPYEIALAGGGVPIVGELLRGEPGGTEKTGASLKCLLIYFCHYGGLAAGVVLEIQLYSAAKVNLSSADLFQGYIIGKSPPFKGELILKHLLYLLFNAILAFNSHVRILSL